MCEVADSLEWWGAAEVQHFSEPGGLSLVCQPEVNDSSPYNTCWSSAQKRGAGGAALFQHWQRVRRLEGLISCFGVRHREIFLVPSFPTAPADVHPFHHSSGVYMCVCNPPTMFISCFLWKFG